MPTSDCGDDFVWVLGPLEGCWGGIGFGEEPLDRRLHFDDGAEDTTFETPPGQFSEIAFDGIEPGGRGRREVEGPARMPRQPCANLWMLVRGVVVDDGMDQLAGRD